MLTDPNAAVTGGQRLHVADAFMPRITRPNGILTSIMIREGVTDHIRGRA